MESYDINSKYERMPRESIQMLKELSFSQMSKIFSPYWGKKSERLGEEHYNDEDEITDSSEDEQQKSNQKKEAYELEAPPINIENPSLEVPGVLPTDIESSLLEVDSPILEVPGILPTNTDIPLLEVPGVLPINIANPSLEVLPTDI